MMTSKISQKFHKNTKTWYLENETLFFLQIKKFINYTSSATLWQRIKKTTKKQNKKQKQQQQQQNQPCSGLGILKYYICIMSLFEAFDQKIWSYTYIVCYK